MSDKPQPDSARPEPTPMQSAFMDIMSNFAASVTVVTSTHEGRDHGLTVSAFASVSLDPLLILVCIEYRSHSLEAMRHAEGFTVNMLRQGMGEVAMNFASKDDEKFDGLATLRPSYEAAGPLLPEQSYAILECRTVDILDAGDHMVFIGHVENAARVDPGSPLLYWRRGFHNIGPDFVQTN